MGELGFLNLEDAEGRERFCGPVSGIEDPKFMILDDCKLLKGTVVLSAKISELVLGTKGIDVPAGVVELDPFLFETDKDDLRVCELEGVILSDCEPFEDTDELLAGVDEPATLEVIEVNELGICEVEEYAKSLILVDLVNGIDEPEIIVIDGLEVLVAVALYELDCLEFSCRELEGGAVEF
ncbi:uncharacterized protein MAM_07258 [Metarhizium album ARSEF 1941]|uniref:Uncharacterized protein n=1 Tax=Metarhizium album (strain ARSEF 1941) TaxID=1081103 RepID=A0A0B2WME6_METAS|nr:uncharacterized protein MAM_07258 [Metarhizium album ARSEF 1941]KHN94839.1 hypothetical protein MAM_07258 [Metarhizium album ARSEF 1941]